MKHIPVTVSFAALVLLGWGCTQPVQEPETFQPTTFKEKSSYVGGLDIGKSLQTRQEDVDLRALIQGLEDSFQGKEPLITPEEAAEIKKEYAEQVRKEREEKNKALAEKNKTEGEAFLAENAKKPGVVTTESGLQYMVLSEGEGPKPKESDQVKVDYVGTLLDGTEFDSSHKRGQPASFQLNRVIKGWTEGLQLMSIGSQYRFFIPSDLAYGNRAAGPKIGPNAMLTFEVELLEIVGAQPAEKAPAESP